jgi:hypothetical protein
VKKFNLSLNFLTLHTTLRHHVRDIVTLMMIGHESFENRRAPMKTFFYLAAQISSDMKKKISSLLFLPEAIVTELSKCVIYNLA